MFKQLLDYWPLANRSSTAAMAPVSRQEVPGRADVSMIVPAEILKSHRATEDRLDGLRQEAQRTGRVADTGVLVVGGPIPRDMASVSGYYGQPIVKPPVWTWQIALYLFVGVNSRDYSVSVWVAIVCSGSRAE